MKITSIDSSPPPPGLVGAAAMIAAYFALQLVIFNLFTATLGFVLGIRHGGDAKAGAALRALLAQDDVRAALVTATLLLAAPACLWLIRRRWPQAWSQRDGEGLGFASAPPSLYVGALLLGLCLPLLGGVLTQWLAHGQSVPQDVRQLGENSSIAPRLLLALVAVTLGPLLEEVLFRGLLLGALRRHLGDGAAITLGAALFALVHLPDLAYHWYALPNLALLGLALGWLRLRAGSLWPGVLAHGANNLLAVLSWFGPLAGQG